MRDSSAARAETTLTGAEVSGFQARALGRLAQAAGQRNIVELWLRRGLDDPQSGYLAQFELCRLYWDEGQRDVAREMCRDTQASAAYWLDRGYAADQAGDRDAALNFYQMAAAVDPALIAAWQQAGNSLFGLGRYDEAIPAYERVLALASTPPVAVIHSLGRAYLAVDNLTMARDVLNRGLAHYPNQREIFLVMAETYRQEADRITAESWYVRILQRWPGDDQTWAKRAEVAAADARWEDAIEYYQEAAKLRPEDSGYWLGLAAAAAVAGNTALATHAYQQALALRPDDPGLWLRAGRFLAETEQINAARVTFEHVLELQPDHAEAAAQLSALDNTVDR
jgi:tetratricopeptide (TPR) repeat protein